MAPQLPQPIRNALDAANLGDSAAFTACFWPHRGCIDDWGRKHHGDDGIQRWSQRELVDKHATIKVIHFYVASDAEDTTVIAHLDRADFNGPATLTFRLREQRIVTMAITA